jgi:hypothetical protein
MTLSIVSRIDILNRKTVHYRCLWPNLLLLFNAIVNVLPNKWWKSWCRVVSTFLVRARWLPNSQRPARLGNGLPVLTRSGCGLYTPVGLYWLARYTVVVSCRTYRSAWDTAIYYKKVIVPMCVVVNYDWMYCFRLHQRDSAYYWWWAGPRKCQFYYFNHILRRTTYAINCSWHSACINELHIS